MPFPAPETRYITVPLAAGVSARVACHLWGPENAAKTALCVHGLSRNGRDFDFLAQELVAQGYRVICPDMPGRGKSEWLADKNFYNYEYYVAVALAVAESFDVRSCDWIGTSMGGIIGMMVAAHRPELIHRLVLNDIGAVVACEGLQRIAGYAGRELVYPSREAAEAQLRVLFAPFGLNAEWQWQHLFEHTLVQKEDGNWQSAFDPDITATYRTQTKNFSQIEDINLTPVWNKIRCPVLVIRGAESDILRAATAQDMAQTAQTLHPVAVMEVPGVGHAPALMDAEQIAQVMGWLARPLHVPHAHYAGLWIRVAACCIDLALFTPPYLLLRALLPDARLLAESVFAILALLAYAAFFSSCWQGSPGMRVTGVYICTVSGKRLRFSHALAWGLAGTAGWLVCFAGIMYLTARFDLDAINQFLLSRGFEHLPGGLDDPAVTAMIGVPYQEYMFLLLAALGITLVLSFLWALSIALPQEKTGLHNVICRTRFLRGRPGRLQPQR